MDDLSAQLEAARAGSPLSDSIQFEITRMIDALIADGAGRALPALGSVAPSFTLPDSSGKPWELDSALRDGPAVVIFYRGPWCPYCNLQLNAFEGAAAEIQAAGAQLAAISSRAPDDSMDAGQRGAMRMTVLRDANNLVAERYGLSFAPPRGYLDALSAEKYDFAELTETNPPRLSIPATLIIGADRRVHFAQANLNYRERVDPATVIGQLGRLSAAG